MRHSRRPVARALFLGSLIAGLFVWAACGDDDNASSADAGSDAANDVALDRAPTPVIADDSGSTDSGGDGAIQTGDRDAGIENVILDGGDIDGGIPCTSDGKLEQEPNDTMDEANLVTLPDVADPGSNPPVAHATICGVLRYRTDLDGGIDAGDAGDAGDGGDAGDAEAGVIDPIENDWLTFTILPDAIDYYVQYQGDGLQIFLIQDEDGGAGFDITATPSPTLPFHNSSRYFIRIRSTDGQQHPWRITVYQDLQQ